MKKLIILAIFIFMIVIPINASEVDTFNSGVKVKSQSVAKEVMINDDIKGLMEAYDEGVVIDSLNYVIDIDRKVIDFCVIDDLDNDGFNDLALWLDTLNSEDNVMILSTKEKKVLKTYDFTRLDNVDEKIQEVNSTLFKMISIDGVVYATYDYHFVAFNLELLFDIEFKDNVWDIENINDEIIAISTQFNEVIFINKLDGSIIKDLTVTEDIQMLEPYSYDGSTKAFKCNVFDLLMMNDTLYATCENGQIVAIDINTFEIIDNILLGLYSDTEIQSEYSSNPDYFFRGGTSLRTNSFMNYRLQALDDSHILISAFMGDQRQKFNDLPSQLKPCIAIYDLNENVIEYKVYLENANVKCFNALISNIDDKKVIITVSNVKENALMLNIYDASNLELINKKNISYHGIKTDDTKVYISESDNNYYIQVLNNLSFKLSKDMSKITSIGNFTNASLIYSDENSLIFTYNKDGKVFKLAKYNKDKELIKEVLIDESRLSDTKGVENIKVSNGYITALINHKKDETITRSELLMFDLDLNYIVNSDVVLDKGYDYYGKYYINYLCANDLKLLNDLNKDGYRELLADTKVIDGRTLKFKYELYVGTDYPNNIEVGDINGDGISEIVAINDKEARLYNSSLNYYGVEYYKSKIVYKFSNNNLENEIYAKAFFDLDNDGIKDIVINERNEKQFYRVLNAKDLSVKYDLMKDGVYDWNESFANTNIDFNNDGVLDLHFKRDPNNTIIDGKTGNELFSYLRFEYGDMHEYPPTVIEHNVPINIVDFENEITKVNDINNDGVSDFVHFKENFEGFNLCIIDGQNYETIKNVNFGHKNYFKILNIKDSDKLLLSGENSDIYDMNVGLLSSFKTKYDNLIALNENEVLALSSGVADVINIQNDIILNNEVSDVITNEKLALSWMNDGEMTISDNNTNILVTSDKEANIKLLKGHHLITLSLSNGNKISHLNIEIDVNKADNIYYLSFIIIPLAIIIAFAIKFYPKYKFKKKVGELNVSRSIKR